jgi:hypothetical protein
MSKEEIALEDLNSAIERMSGHQTFDTGFSGK